MDVKYVTVEASKLATVPIVNGQIIAISDQDAWFYDMEGLRRPVSGHNVVTELPSDTDRVYPNTLFIVSEGDNKGIHWWDGKSFHLIAGLNTDENVNSQVAELGIAYLVGSAEADTSTGTLKKHVKVYLDLSTGKLHAEGFEGGPADKALTANKAELAAKAESDDKGQIIADTYIKQIKTEGTTVTVTYGNGQTKQFETQDTDTHSVTNVVFGNSPDASSNVVASNGDVYMNVLDDTQKRSSHKISGSGSVEVTSDAQGNLDIKGTIEWKPNTSTEDGYVPAAGDPDKMWATDSEGNPIWRDIENYTHPDSGVTPGIYKSVKVDSQGHVTDGTNPTTLEEYGIVDAAHYSVLPDDANLNDIQESGFYVGRAGNHIANKPDSIDSFGMVVIKSSEGKYFTQKLFGSGLGSDGTFVEVHQYSRNCKNNAFVEWSIDKLTDTIYEHPTDPGYLHIPEGGSDGQVLIWYADGQAVWGDPGSVSVPVMEGSTEESAGRAGLVPSPDAGPATAYLRNDGTWATPPDTKYGDMIGTDGYSAGQSGLVPAPTTEESDMYLNSDGTWHKIETHGGSPQWDEYIPE